ncbi:MAG: SBBP repeat-containing protein, partial [candidate division WOR-3 bacterium]|nr:SBBP repeat-containing protein [candidate division WOR-3 bacterium]MDW8150197.1 SBBP repeat-containing protein [candidate division WOR-3 bacterium]
KDREIEMKTSNGLLIDGNLVAYENDNKIEVSYRYKENEIGFVVYGYSGNNELVIDPQLTWATYYGGNDDDYAISISTDNNNNVYVVGSTWSTNFPTQNPEGGAYFQGSNAGYSDAFISKFSPTVVFTNENKLGIYDIFKIKNNKIILNIKEPMELQFRIYTIDGTKKKELNLRKLNIGTYEISIKDLEKGIYIVEVILDNRKEIIRFVKN